MKLETEFKDGKWYKRVDDEYSNCILQYNSKDEDDCNGYWERGYFNTYYSFDTTADYVLATKEDLAALGTEWEEYWVEDTPLVAKFMEELDQVPYMREFTTGATRNTDEDKIDFEGFLSPLALEEFAKYMHTHRIQADGKLRDSDNWQKGIPMEAYMKSMYRHFFDTWKNYRGLETPEEQITNLCGMLFNVQGMLHELLKKK